jgi:hypothetical protein
MNKYISLYLLSSIFAFSQTQSRVDSTNRSLPSPAKDSIQQSSNIKNTDIKSSDTGAQRPVSLKKTGFSGNFGFDTNIAYKENPLGAPGLLDQQADAVWVNKFHGMAKLGVYELDSSVLTPFVGGSWSLTDYTYKNENEAIPDLGVLNHNTTTSYLLFLLQHESGWAFRGGVMYSSDTSTEHDTEEYKEFFPSIGVTKAYSLGENLLSVLDASFGSHYGEIDDADGPANSSHSSDELDHLDFTASYSVIYTLEKLSITPSYSISYRKYDNGFNFDRSDILHNIGVLISYPISESFELSVNSNYSKRVSDGTDESGDSYKTLYDFKKFDVGTALSLTARF